MEQLGKYYIHLLRIKLKLNKEQAYDTYLFLNELSRFALCESHILSMNNDFFRDFINLEKEKALNNFDKYYGILEDYDLNLNLVAKGGTFFTNLIEDFDKLLIQYYWESIIKSWSGKEIKHRLLELGETILGVSFRVDNMMMTIYEEVLNTIKKSIVKKFLDNTKLEYFKCEKYIENFLAIPINSLEMLLKNTKKVLKLDISKDIKQILDLENWLFTNDFRNAVQLIITNGLSENVDMFTIFLSLLLELENNFGEKDEEFLELIYNFRKHILFTINDNEKKFYKKFVSKYQVQFKHKGTYSITYLEDYNKAIEKALIRFSSLKKEIYEKGKNSLIKQINDIRKRMEYYENILQKKRWEKKSKNEQNKKKRRFKTKQKNINKVTFQKIIIEELFLIETNISNDNLKLKTDLQSIILSLRRTSVFFHIFISKLKLDVNNARFLYEVFIIVFLDSILMKK